MVDASSRQSRQWQRDVAAGPVTKLQSIGTAKPPFGIDLAESLTAATLYTQADRPQSRMLQVLYRRSGIARRSSVVILWPDGPIQDRQIFFPLPTAEAPRGPTTGERMQQYAASAGSLAVSAAQQALAGDADDPRAISHLVIVTCSGFAAPGVDLALINGLGLAATVERTQVGFMGCHAALNGLRVARALAAQSPEHRVLVVCVELCTLHYQYGWHPDWIVANSLFADGAAAVIVSQDLEATAQGNKASANSPDSSHRWQIAATGSCLIPDSADAMTWKIGDHGFEMTVSSRVPDLIAGSLKPWLTGWLDRQGVPLEDVNHWAIHPGGPRILETVGECLQLQPPDWQVSTDVLAQHGNMSSPTILFILDRLRQQPVTGPTVAIAFGPGLVAEAVLLLPAEPSSSARGLCNAL